MAGAEALRLDARRPVAERLIELAAPAAVYLGVRLVGLVMLAIMAARDGTDVLTRLSTWDGAWLRAIAEHGYDVPDDMLDLFGHHTPTTALCFFPGYPAAVAAVGTVTGGDLVIAGLVVSLVSGIAAAYALARLGELVPGGSRQAGLVLVGLFAATPMAVVLSMTYTEAMFCAFAAWALVGVLRRQWLLAGLCAAGAGLVRPTASSLVAAVALAALVAVLGGGAGWRPWAGAVLSTTGILGYLGYVALQTGSPTGWFAIQQAGWASSLDGGGATARYAVEVLFGGDKIFDVLTLVAILGTAALLVIGVKMRVPWPLLVYGALVLVTVWGTDGVMSSKLRLLVPAFTLLLPPAIALGRRSTGTAVAVVAAAAVASAWFGGYALTIWPYGI
ncbi:hypothetical protein [Pseudonocardia sp. GCM10023141]|uniref:hypothetical protein n=1 Tax=Pseudonocardia sp. GCM10023141 TaxID=3252653 RepID=UPI0036141D28